MMSVNRLFPNLKQIRTINISDEVIEKEPYKVEDIQASRQSEFERQMQQKKEEFESIASFKKPAELDFSEKPNEGKITEMQALIAETIAKRNFEVEQFQNANANPNFQSESETWLQPTNTSVKSEKVNANKTALSASEYRKPNYKEPNIRDSNKKVTWDEDNININTNFNNMELVIEETTPITNLNENENVNINVNNIFNKLKKIPTSTKEKENISEQIAALNTKFDTMINLMTNLIDTIHKKE